jgi:hypothetical protein
MHAIDISDLINNTFTYLCANVYLWIILKFITLIILFYFVNHIQMGSNWVKGAIAKCNHYLISIW